jgi:phage tail tape-measure protein
MFKGLTEGLSETIGESAGGWVLAGAAVLLFAPTLRNALRGVVVGTTRGVLSLAEGGTALATNMKSGWNDIVKEAKTQKSMTNVDTGTMVGAGAGGALGATLGSGMGPMGAAVGGGLGSVVGATVGNTITEDDEKNHHSKGKSEKE